MQNQALVEENVRSRAFIEKLLHHPAFTPFLEDLSRDESINNKMPMAAPAPQSVAPTPAPQQQFAQQQNLQVGMTLIPETPLDLSMLNINGNYPMTNGFNNFPQPQVFAVMEVPAGPANPLNMEALSGKGYESVMDEVAPVEQLKHDLPVVKNDREEKQVEAKPAETEEDAAFDSNPAFALFHAVPTTSATVSQAPISISEKPHFQLVEVASEATMQRFERMMSRMDAVAERIAARTAHLEG